ncbi:MAG: hypothetical protein FWF63_02800 [Fibromonadales bacterium]|nr:hypothetical protein [Fibromonadales bacterium]
MTFRSKCTMLLAVLLFSCTEVERNNPYDERSKNYQKNKPSSSSNSDSNSKLGACYLSDGNEEAFCFEGIEASITRSECEEFVDAQDYDFDVEFKFLNSCPSGYVLKCPIAEIRYLYFYGEGIKGYTCDDLFKEEEYE